MAFGCHLQHIFAVDFDDAITQGKRSGRCPFDAVVRFNLAQPAVTLARLIWK